MHACARPISVFRILRPHGPATSQAPPPPAPRAAPQPSHQNTPHLTRFGRENLDCTSDVCALICPECWTVVPHHSSALRLGGECQNQSQDSQSAGAPGAGHVCTWQYATHSAAHASDHLERSVLPGQVAHRALGAQPLVRAHRQSQRPLRPLKHERRRRALGRLALACSSRASVADAGPQQRAVVPRSRWPGRRPRPPGEQLPHLGSVERSE